MKAKSSTTVRALCRSSRRLISPHQTLSYRIGLISPHQTVSYRIGPMPYKIGSYWIGSNRVAWSARRRCGCTIAR